MEEQKKSSGEKWEKWQEHSISEPIVVAKSGQTIDIWDRFYTLKSDIVVCVEKYRCSCLHNECLCRKLKIVNNDEFVHDIYPDSCHYDIVDGIVKDKRYYLACAQIIIGKLVYEIKRVLLTNINFYNKDLHYLYYSAIKAYFIFQHIISKHNNTFQYDWNRIKGEKINNGNNKENSK